ncbi:SRPBCC family protein [Actinomadura rudentiformis]|uniref:Carbon monoxide dehydrogenase subunit G n=1 Tax=Actinomadura rudentiformis TaxID=359158 RepID=A0A6H9YTM3_9ACTN|nr:carbon monoxide dehydrogenase subunit G [Actinomadura rudentiformis]KAB2343048.1 carbon monoxide dehydrogenase subunit G [Actinomadura rudentiformis]
MKVTGSATVAAPLPRVWDALQDPSVLALTIPGCESLEALGDDRYRMTVQAGVASIKGTYTGEVALTDPDPPRSFVLRAKGQGAPGTVDATVRVRLGEGDGEGSTLIEYDADAVVGGMVGGVGQRMLAGVAKRTAGEFFTAVERALNAPVAGAVSGAVSGAVPEGQGARALKAGPGEFYPGAAFFEAERPVAPMVIAFGVGGAVALAGVAIGHALARRSRR